MGENKKSKAEVEELSGSTDEQEVSPKREKKSKKSKKCQAEDPDEAEIETPSKPKKSKKSKRRDEDSAEEEVEEDPSSKKHKKSKKSKRNDEHEEPTATSEPEPKSEEAGGKSQGADNALSAHNAKLSKMLPTREERARREKQRKMQAYVIDLRAQGMSEEEIKKMKKKITNKLSKIGTNVPYASVGGMADITLVCKDCGGDFVFTCREQNFYREKALAPAVRCRACVTSKRERMAHFDEQDKTKDGRRY